MKTNSPQNRNTLTNGRNLRLVALLIFLVILLHLSTNTIIKDTAAQGPCGDTYIVLPGDTLSEIAELCGTTVEAILRLNPEITDPDNLYSGQILRIPKVAPIAGTLLALSPSCGLPGQNLLVVGSGYPKNVYVQLSIGQKDVTYSVVGGTISDQYGRIDSSLILPSSAPPGTIWSVIGEAQISSAKFIGVSNDFSVIGEPPDPNAATTYLVQEGDTLISITAKFDRDLESILEANPQITGAERVNPGQTINIPPQDPETPITQITPTCGPTETDIQINGTEFPPSATVNLSIGHYLVSYTQVGSATVLPNRTFQTEQTIPATAQIGEYWVVIASTSTFPSVRSTSNIFTITKPKDPKSPELYIVQPGDTMNQIAVEYKRTVATILNANPQISNPNQLLIGEKIIIPGQKESILISPISGAPLTRIQVGGIGYSPNSIVTLGFARDDILYSILGTVYTDVNGIFRTEYVIPNTAQRGDIWKVVSVEPDEIGGEITTASNEFVVTSPQPQLQPIITLWPHEGPPGTELSVVGSNFPANNEIRYSLGEVDESLYFIATTWTEINGTFAVDLIIPRNAEIGGSWIVSAEVIEDPGIQGTSPLFTVVEP